MKETLKRLTCMLLALIMVAGMFPVSVFAEAENPISVDAGSTVSNVIGPIGAPEESQEPAQDPVEEEDEEPAEVVPEAPAFDPTEPIHYRTPHNNTFSLLSVLAEAGVSVNTITDVSGELTGKVAANVSGSDWLLTPFNYFDKIDLSVTAKNSPDGEEAVYTVVLFNPDPATDPYMPAVKLSETMADGVIITAKIPEDSLPAGVKMRVVNIDVRQAVVTVLIENGFSAEAAEKTVQMLIDNGENLADYVAAYDVSFYLPEDPATEIEPKAAVEVSFERLNIITASQDEIEVYHVADNGNVDTLDSDTSTENGEVMATVVTDAFSPLLFSNTSLLLGATDDLPDPITGYNTIAECAEAYYGPFATDPHTQIFVSVTESNPSTDRADNTRSYTVNYGWNAIPTWKKGYDQEMGLFDSYENNKITIKLPAGLLIPEGGIGSFSFESSPNDKTNPDPTVPHTYTIDLGGNITDAGGSFFTFTVYIGNNAQLDANGNDLSVTSYDLPDDFVTMHTEFTVIDRLNNVTYPVYDPYKYTQDVYATAADFTTVTDDIWGVEKATVPTMTKVEGNVATFTWKVTVGLLTGPAPGGTVIKTDSVYARAGRDAFKLDGDGNPMVYLKDTFTTTLSKDGSTLTPIADSVKIQKSDDDTSETGFSSGTPIQLKGKLEMDKDANVVTNSVSTSPVYTWTEYTVSAQYEVTEDMIADFSNNGCYTLDSENTAETDITRADGVNQTDSETKTQSVNLPVTKPAELTIDKRLRDYTGSEHDYDTEYGKDIYEAITYTLSASESFKVYGIEGNNYVEKYTATQDGNIYSVSGLSSDTVYYLTSGIEYWVKEDLSQSQVGNMALVSYSWGPTPSNSKADYTPTQTSTEPVKHTPAQGEAWTTQVINRETKGSVTINKKDDWNNKLGKVPFTLYTDESCSTIAQMYKGADMHLENATGITSENGGVLTLGALGYGTYYLKEVATATNPLPTGYYLSADQGTQPDGVTWDSTNKVWKIVIDDTNRTITINAVNVKTRATLRLLKYVGVAENMPITNRAIQEYPATFELECTTTANVNTLPGTSGWTTVTSDIDGATISTTMKITGSNSSTTDKGTTSTLNLPAYDSNGNVYWYRYKETIPTGYYDALTGATDYSYSTPTHLIDTATGKAKDTLTQVEMFNRRMIRTYVNKNNYKVGTNGTTSNDSNISAKVKLYYYVETGTTPTSVTQYGTEEKTVKSGTYAIWDNLMAFDYTERDANNNPVPRKIHYLVKETPDDATFTLDENQGNLTIVTIGGVRYIDITVSTAGSSSNIVATEQRPYQPNMSKTLYNVQQLIPVQIYKRNYYTNAPIAGAKVTVYNADGTTVAQGRVSSPTAATQSLQDVVIPYTAGGSANYLYIYLEPGKEYTFVESDNQTGLRFHSYDVTTTVSGQTVGSINLTGYTQTYSNRGDTKSLTRNIYNYDDPIIRVNKVDSVSNEPVNGPKFTVYVKNSTTGKYETYPLGGTPMVINSNDTESTNKLPASDLLPTLTGYTGYEGYYFAETDIPEDYLNPNENYDEYYALDSNYVQGETSDGTTLTFLKAEVVNAQRATSPSSSTPNTFTFTAKNIPNKGNLTVLKYVDGELDTVGGFPITWTDNKGNTNTSTTDENGSVTFTNLPVYDSDGKKLKYTITEDETQIDSKYYKVSDGQVAELAVGTTTDKDNTTEHNTLIVHNATRIDVFAYKDKLNTWDYQYTHMTYPMEGAKIGLFVKGTDGNWTLVPAAECGGTNPQTSDGEGRVDFTGLRRDRDYALVELASGDASYFPWISNKVVDNGYPAGGVNCQTISNSLMTSDPPIYNILFLNQSTTAVTPGQDPKMIFDAGQLNNANHWLQFDVTKWLDADTQIIYHENAPTEYHPHGLEVDKANDTKLNNCIFEMYRCKVVGDTVPAFTGGEDANWKLVNSYSTGTEHDENGNVLPGQFRTDVEQGMDSSYVYLIVETSVGPNSGVIYNPNFVYSFWHAEGTDYAPPSVPTVQTDPNVPNHETVVRDLTYKFDQVNYEDVLNSKVEGPGPGSPWFLASLRLSKWQDSINEISGKPDQIYKPLPNAVFKLVLAEDESIVLSELTTGLDDYAHGTEQTQPVAMAQGKTIQLRMTQNTDGTTTYSLYDYEIEGYIKENVIVEETTVGSRPAWRILTRLYETETPVGYSYVTSGYDMWLYFVDLGMGGENWVFNDAYFVTDTSTDHVLSQNQGDEIAWYVTTATADAPATGIGSPKATLRIVNYPMQNTLVTVTKYGYRPNSNTVGMTSTALDELKGDALAAINREKLNGVTMILKHLNENNSSWEFWNYKSNKPGTEEEASFSTDAEGFMFPKGLIPGTYMIYETSLGSTQNTLNYELAYPDEGHSRIFTVEAAAVNVTMYNPRKLSLTLVKQDMENAPKEGFTFALDRYASASATAPTSQQTATTNGDGIAVFSNLETGYYKLTENSIPAGYSKAYLTKYLKAVYGLESITTSPTLLGYTYNTSGDNTDSDVVISAIGPASTINPSPVTVSGANITLTVKDPGLGRIQITKLKDDGTALTGTNTNMRAGFTGYYRAFSENAFGPDGETIDFTGIDLSTSAKLISNGFERKTALDGYTDQSTGIFSKTSLDPGIYAFYESSAPNGYEIPTTSTGGTIFYFLVVKGGMDVEVIGLPQTVTAKDGSTVTTYYEETYYPDESSFAVKLGITNHKKVNIYGRKVIENGELPGGAPTDWEVRYDIYSDAACTSTTLVATLTLTNNATQVFKAPNATTAYGFNPYTHYYMKETLVKPTQNFELETIERADNDSIWKPTEENGGIYDIWVDSDDYVDGITITVTNIYLWGRVTFAKVAEEDASKYLDGAQFEVRIWDSETEKWVPLDGAIVGPAADTGIYQADIPLVSAEKTKYRIYETAAPEPYVTDTTKFIEVELEFKRTETTDPETNETTISYTGNVVNIVDDPIINTKGYDLTIIKFDNTHDAADIAARVGQGDATFMLFYSDDGETWSILKDAAQTSGPDDQGEHSGEVYQLMTPNKYYAVLESAFSDRFTAKDGVYDVDGNLLNTVSITIGSTNYDVYKFGPVTGNITLYAYNVPLVEPTIIKRDKGGYPVGVIPTAEFEIYQVSADLLAGLDDQGVEDFLANNPAPVFTGKTSHEGMTDEQLYSKATWHVTEADTQPPLNYTPWDYTKNYLLVETKVAATSGTYNTMNKDDNRVNWYVPIPAHQTVDPSDPPEFELDNVYSALEFGVVKATVQNSDVTTTVEAADTANAVVDNRMESLLTADPEIGRNVIYTLTPSITSYNQPLTGFKLADTGLTFTQPAAGDGYEGPRPSYSIKKVFIGANAYHNISNLDFEITGDTEIYAQITFQPSGSIASGPYKVSGVTNPVEVEAPAGTQSFTIEYYSPGVASATEDTSTNKSIYVLGQDFSVDPTTVYVKVNQLADGSSDKPVAQVSEFKNSATLTVEKNTWKNDGSGREYKSDTKDSSATVKVNGIKLPTISVEKDSEPSENIQPNSYIKYTVKLKNTSTTEVLKNPVALDIMPSGVTYVANDEDHPTKAIRTAALPDFDVHPVRYSGSARQIENPDPNGPPFIYGDQETAVLFELTGVMQPGETVTLTFFGKVAQNVQMYGEYISNDVYMSSTEHSYHTTRNPMGYPYWLAEAPGEDQDEYADWLKDAAQANKNNASGTDDSAVIREECMESALGDYAKKDNNGNPYYVWVPAYKSVTVNTSGGVKVRKAVQGDLDEDGYHDEGNFLGSATRTVAPATETHNEKHGWVNWRLSVYNGFGTDMTKVAVGDALPYYDSTLGTNSRSMWDAVMDHIIGVLNDETLLSAADPTTYTKTDSNYYYLYYYFGAHSGATAEIENRIGDARSWPQSQSANPAAGWYADGHLAGGKTVADATAFMIVLGEQAILKQAKTLVITYHTLTENIRSDDTFNKRPAGFENAANEFFMQCNEQAVTYSKSNVVSVTLLDGEVSVEGDLWIDEDLDGTQESENRRDYSQYDILQKLVSAMKFSITDQRAYASGATSEDDHGGNWLPQSDYGLGESIKHFVFEALGPATHVEGRELYTNGQLNTSALKTTDPFNYIVNAAITTSSSGLTEDMLSVFKHTFNVSPTFYESDDPDDLDENNIHAFDDNFELFSGNTYKTRAFYLRYADTVDQSKDIGCQMFRDLVITKLAQGTTTALPNAEFEIYGPFKDSDLNASYAHTAADRTDANRLTFTKNADGAYVLDPAGTITTLVTGDDGKIKVIGLNWWKEYDIVETKAAEHYTIAGTTHTATSAETKIVSHEDGSFTLKVPGCHKLTREEDVTVENPPSEVPMTPKATKSMEGEKTSDDLEFTFSLKLISQKESETSTSSIENGAYIITTVAGQETKVFLIPGTAPIEQQTITIPAGYDPAVGEPVIATFSVIHYIKPGIYVYEISEIPGNKNAVKYSGAVWTYTVVAAYNDKGELTATESYVLKTDSTVTAETAEFVNKYIPKPVEWTPQAKKFMTGEPIPNDKTFTFKLTALSNPKNGATLPVIDPAHPGEISVIVKAKKTESDIVVFEDTLQDGTKQGIVFSKAGTYVFQVAEVIPDPADPHIDYTGAAQGAEATFTVTVVDDHGELKVTNVTPTGDVDQTGITVTAKFTNKYWVTPTDYTPKIWKLIVGQKTVEDLYFKFEISAGVTDANDPNNNYTNPAGASLTGRETKEIRIPKGKTGINYYEDFSTIEFTSAGTYKFTVREVQPGEGQGAAGVTYSDAVYILTVEVTDTNGVLSASVTSEPEDLKQGYAYFENSYNVTPTYYKPPVKKVIEGEPLVVAKTFYFDLTANAYDENTGFNPVGGATIPSGGERVSVTVQAGETNATAEFDPAIKFTQAGTYTFTVTEDDTNPYIGFTYDRTPYTLKVIIQDDGGALSVQNASYSGGISTTTAEFVNPYQPLPVKLIPEVSKELTQFYGKTKVEKTFNFTLQAYASNPAGAAIRVVQTLVDGTKLDKTSLKIPAGSTGADVAPAKFGEIEFTKAGNYQFLIKEVNDGDGSITYDPTEWTLAVAVIDKPDGSGELILDPNNPPTYNGGSTAPKFKNDYIPTPTELELPVEKTLEGNNPPKKIKFTFELALTDAVDENNVDIKDKNTSDPTTGTAFVEMEVGGGTTGDTQFPKIKYTAAGTYTYTIKETVATEPGGMKWDKAEYEVTVTVVNNTNDELSATYSIKQTKDNTGAANDPAVSIEGKQIPFVNEYKPEPVEDYLSVRKVITKDSDRWPQIYENIEFIFSEIYLSGDLSGFEVVDPTKATMPTQAGNVVEQVKIKGVDAVAGKTEDFSNLKFTKDGTYVFRITESKHNPEVEGVNYDVTVWEVTIVVTDAGNGSLSVKHNYKPKIYPDGIHNENDEYAFFTNGYDNGVIPYTPSVIKRVTVDYGPLVAKKTFHFVLTADKNNPEGADFTSSETVSIPIDAGGTSGSADFTQITFTSASPAGKPFKFTLTETVETEKGIIYSREICTLEVTVKDEGGKLTETHVYKDKDGHEIPLGPDEAGPTFINRYVPTPTTYQPEVKKTVPGNRLPKAMDFSFTLTLTSQPALPEPNPDNIVSYVWINNSNPGEEANWKEMPTKDTDSVTITVPKGSTGATETGYFKYLKFTKAGTYKFTIAEDTPSGYNGITDDTTVWTLTVVVVDTDGKLEVDTTRSGYSYVDSNNATHTGTEASFSNPYKPEPTHYQPLVDKKMTTEFGPTVEEKKFKFTLTLDSQIDPDNKPMTDGAIIPKDGDKVEIVIPAGKDNGSGSFGNIEFVKAGTYTFTIEEKPSGYIGITDDTTVWTLTVEVTDEDGKLTETHSYSYTDATGTVITVTDTADIPAKATFTNPYKPEPTHYQPLVDKKMTTEFGPTTEDKTFNFTLELTEQKDAADVAMTDGAIIPTNGDKAKIVVPAGKDNASGSFGDIDFVKAGTYVFEIKEVEETDPSITYDGTTWTLTVEVTDENGKLTETHSYSYTDATGTVITVTDTAGVPAKATFTNPYKPDPTEYQPKVRKDIELVTGAPTTLDKHFTFDLKFYSAFTDDWEKLDAYQLDAAETDGGKQFDSDTVTITIPAGVATSGEEPIPFKEIHFTRAGRYTYKITERVTIPELGMTYDQAEWTLTVIVRDADGKLEIADANYTSNWTNSRENREAAKFVNPYTTGNLRVTKRVSGTGASTSTKFTFKVTLYTENVGGERTPLPGTYPVEIYNNKTGELVDTATVENGTATFKLKHEQTAIIRNIPVGVKWEVEEERAFGYSTSAETPNKGTIQKGENISNWKNHRSTVPPIPRTGYGDGTTVKVGLGTSLGVFLASAIGSILQSKNAKKKKRGGGSHAAN